MRFLHTSDLHIGKTLESCELYEDTEYVLKQVEEAAEREKVDAVLISGDIFDRSVPSERAVRIYEDFIARLTQRDGIRVIAIAGNHDSGIRVAANSSLLARTGLYYVAGELTKEIQKVTLTDGYGPVDFYLLPYFKPAEVADLLGMDHSSDLTDDQAFVEMLKLNPVDRSHRNVLLAHLFAAGYVSSGSEQFAYSSVASLSNIAVNRFDDFDYVALGHIHRPEAIGRETIRYSGSLLKYKISECSGPDRSFCIVDMGAKGERIDVKLIPVKPLHPVVEISDYYDNLIRREADDSRFVFLHLLDERWRSNAMTALSKVFPHLISIDYPNIVGGDVSDFKVDSDIQPADLALQFYRERSHKALSAEDEKLVRDIFAEIEKEGE